MKVNGKYCTFDYSRQPTKANFANLVVSYVDRKAPEVFTAVGLGAPTGQVDISFANINGGMFKTPNKIEISDNLSRDDLGCLIHECVHWTQQMNQSFYNAHQKIVEGVADYYRIVLSDDRQGDYVNNDKRNLVKVFNPNELWDSGSEFIAYLRRASGNGQFVKLLNDALRTTKTQVVNQFFKNEFGQSFNDLHSDYPNRRAAVVGNRPENVNRFDFFTTMPK